jgi:hypothetical protein
MQDEISDEAAIEFTASFYQALAANLPIDAAVSEARKGISLAMPESVEWGTPALYMHAPEGMIWRVQKEEEDTNTDEQVPWWDRLPDTALDLSASDIGGDVIIATVGAGAKNVVVGKNNTQIITEALGEPGPDDRQVIEAGLDRVKATLSQAETEIGQGATKMALAMLTQIGNELLKTGEGENPNAAIIAQMGDLLLDSVPSIGPALASLFATPAVGRAIGKAGEEAVTWVKGRFGGSSL